MQAELPYDQNNAGKQEVVDLAAWRPNARSGEEITTSSAGSPTITLVTEGYNLAEGQSEQSFLRAVAAVEQIALQHANTQVVVLDPTPNNICAPILNRHYPHIQALHVPGQSYDGQKNTVSRMVQSEFVVFLDGDCRPLRDDWLDQILSPFAGTSIPAVCGLTFYDDFSITGKAMSILDFGFLYTHPGGPLGCYVSNNIAFRREAILRIPIPDEGILRCYCFKHAQLFLRSGMPIRFQPKALVLHELPDIGKERFRRGYDYIAALWADPSQIEASWLEASQQFGSRILNRNLNLALRRLANAPAELELSDDDKLKVAEEIRRLIILDIPGIRHALECGKADGSNLRARQAHIAQSNNSLVESNATSSVVQRVRLSD